MSSGGWTIPAGSVGVVARHSLVGGPEAVRLRTAVSLRLPERGQRGFGVATTRTARQVLDVAKDRAGGWWPKPEAVTLNGRAVAADALESTAVESGDVLVVAPAPREPSTIILGVIAVASAVASAALSMGLKATPRLRPGKSAARRYTFGRLSQDAVAGDAIPVVLGELRGYGGKVVSVLPGEGEDGDARLRVLILLGRGPIQSIGNQTAAFDRLGPASLSGLYINDQPIANETGVLVSGRLGEAGQTVIPGFGDIETLREAGAGGTPLRNTSGADRSPTGSPSGEAITYTTIDPVNAATVRVIFPRGLYAVSSSGQTNSRRLQYRLRTRTADVGFGAGTWSAWQTVTLERAEQSEVVSAKRVDNLAAGGGARMDIQIERLSKEPTGNLAVDECRLDSVVEARYAAQTFPGLAMLALELVAGEQRTSRPRIAVDIKGLKNLRIWDGVSSPSSPVFTTGYSDDPADQALALLTDATWGLGNVYGDADIDFPSLLACRVHNREAVGRPGGGTRPRFACHLLLGDARDPLDWLRTICRVMRAVPVTSGRTWRFIQDRPQSAAAEIFTERDIAAEPGGAALMTVTRELTTGAFSGRPNRLAATIDAVLADGRGRDEPIAWPELGTRWLATEPVREESIQLDGVTDPDQALAQLRYLLLRERRLSRSLAFTTTKPLVVAQPGERIDVACTYIGWAVASGALLTGSTTAAVRLDRQVTLEAGRTYTLRVQQPGGAVESAVVSSPAGAYPPGSALALAAPLASAPPEFAAYALGYSGVEMKPFTVTRVGVTAPGTEEMRWNLEAVEYDAGVFDETSPEPAPMPTYGVLATQGVAPGPVSELVIQRRLVSGVERPELGWSQTPADRALTDHFRVYRRLLGTQAWVLIPQPILGARSYVPDLADLDSAHEFRVVAVTAVGAALSVNDARHPSVAIVLGLAAAAPEPPATASLAQAPDGTYTLTWAASADAVQYQVLAGGQSTARPNAGAEDCFVLARATGTSLTGLALAPGLAHRLYVRAVGSNGRLSRTCTLVTISSPLPPPGRTTLATRTMTLDSEGTRTNCTWNSGDAELRLTAAGSPGVYLSPEIDLTTVLLRELYVRILTGENASLGTLADGQLSTPSIAADQWAWLTTTSVALVTPPWPDDEHDWAIEVRTEDGSVWTGWEPLAAFRTVRRVMRRYQVRVTFKRKNPPHQPTLKGLACVVTS